MLLTNTIMDLPIFRESNNIRKLHTSKKLYYVIYANQDIKMKDITNFIRVRGKYVHIIENNHNKYHILKQERLGYCESNIHDGQGMPDSISRTKTTSDSTIINVFKESPNMLLFNINTDIELIHIPSNMYGKIRLPRNKDYYTGSYDRVITDIYKKIDIYYPQRYVQTGELKIPFVIEEFCQLKEIHDEIVNETRNTTSLSSFNSLPSLQRPHKRRVYTYSYTDTATYNTMDSYKNTCEKSVAIKDVPLCIIEFKRKC